MKRFLARSRWLAVGLAVMALMSVSALASANPIHFTANLTTLNDSGVTGTAYLTLNNNTLTVHIIASGLQTGVSHAQHIHGTFDADGNVTNATTPTVAGQDTNGDGYVELGEGQATYGPILVPLSLSPGSGTFPTTTDGSIDYTQTFDLTADATFTSPLARPGTTESDLMPLTDREIVLHGMNAPVDITDNALGLSFTMGEYDPVFPVASGEIMMAVATVPEPAVFGMMILGLGLICGLFWLRRRVDA